MSQRSPLKLILVLSAITFVCQNILAQSVELQNVLWQYVDNDTMNHSARPSIFYIYEGIRNHKSEDYDKAIKAYERVHVNDTNYELALYEKGLSLLANEQYDESIMASEEGMKLNGKLYMSFISNMGTCYSEMKEYENANEVYLEGLKKYPYSSYLKYNRAVALLRAEDPEGLEVLYDNLRINPQHANSHYLLGSLCADNNLQSQATICYITYLMLKGDDKSAAGQLQAIEEYLKGDLEGDGTYSTFEGLAEGFEEIDELVDNKVALEPRYRFGSKLPMAYIKQAHLVLSNLDDVADEDGFWHEFYLPFYEDLMEAGQFEGLSYQSASSFINYSSTVAKVVKKNTSLIWSFMNWYWDAFKKHYSTHTITRNGKEIETQFHYNSGTLYGMGELSQDDEPFGRWDFYFTNGTKRSEGEFTGNGKKTGPWRFYHKNGGLESNLIFKNGEAHGPFETFSSTGVKLRSGIYKNGKYNDTLRVYYETGGLHYFEIYEDGVLDGGSSYFYRNGNKHYDVRFKDGLLDGKYNRYFANGKLFQTRPYDNGKLEGTVETFYLNGQLSDVSEYANHMMHGSSKDYYEDGTLSSEGTYKEGMLIGVNKAYHRNGELKVNQTLDENGKETGFAETYDEDGNLMHKYEYKKGRLIAYWYYNEKGKVISEGAKKGKYLEMKALRPTRAKYSKGTYVKGQKDQDWKYYSASNHLTSKLEYNHGEIDGKAEYYYSDGSVSSYSNYVDDVLKGPHKSYFSGGQLKTDGYYDEDDKIGEWTTYNALNHIRYKNYYREGTIHGWQYVYTENGVLDYKNKYNNGGFLGTIYYDSTGAAIDTIMLDNGTGQFVKKYANGNNALVGHYSNGYANGEFTYYFWNGTVKSRGSYINGSKDGTWEHFFLNGEKSKVEHFALGNLEGKTTSFFNGEGKISWEVQYIGGDRHGEYKEYYRNGQLRTSLNYNYGERHGESRYYDPTGELAMVRNYEEGYLMSFTYQDENGDLVESIDISSDDNDVQAFYKNGKPSISFQFNDQWFQGEYIWLTSAGDTVRQSHNVDSDYNGTVTSFYHDGTLKASEKYELDELHGVSTYYHPNGNVQAKINFYQGERNGTTTFYDKNGKLTSTAVYYGGTLVSKK